MLDLFPAGCTCLFFLTCNPVPPCLSFWLTGFCPFRSFFPGLPLAFFPLTLRQSRFRARANCHFHPQRKGPFGLLPSVLPGSFPQATLTEHLRPLAWHLKFFFTFPCVPPSVCNYPTPNCEVPTPRLARVFFGSRPTSFLIPSPLPPQF